MAANHEDLDVDTFVRIGSAFKILETDQDILKAKEKKAKEAYVLDKQGRRRFHGAFTGGFSAGYYNTVGTKEGWSPATFTSSRKSKMNSSKRQRPEDFMDEEDLDVFGIAPREVSTRDPFTKDTSSNKLYTSNQSSVIPGAPPLKDLVIPSRSTIGAKLLQTMGWKEGQGVGPKVQRPTESVSSKKVYGCSLPNQLKDDERNEQFLFAPHDIAPWQFNCKDNRHGIGYKGMIEQGVLSTDTYSKSLYGMRGQAFGVGALEEDDDDIYSQESLTSYTHTLSTDQELNTSLKYGWTGSQLESWNLDMFVKVKKVTHLKYYAPPKLPHNFVPVHVFTSTAPINVTHTPLTANERQHIVGRANKSVFDYVSSSDKKRIENIVKTSKKDKKTEHTVIKSTPPPSTHHSISNNTVDAHSLFKQQQPLSTIGQTLIDGDYQPFSDNPSKQLRYEAYLSGKRKFHDSNTDHFTEWERKKELNEFSRKARLLKPLSTSLNDKFTKSTTLEHEQDKPVNEEAIEAATIGMFGVMTREQVDWYPHSVLCKRFNIPDPYPNTDTVGVLPVVMSDSKRFKSLKFESSSNVQQQSVFEKETVIEEEEKEEEKQEEKEEIVSTLSRPPMSTFVSIFASDTNYISSYVRKDYQLSTPPKKWTDLSKRTPLQPPVQPLIIQSTAPIVPKEKEPIITTTVEQQKEQSEKETDIFGPSLPPPDLTTTTETDSPSLSRNSHHKHHHSKHKHKHSSRHSSSHEHHHHKKAKHKRKHNN